MERERDRVWSVEEQEKGMVACAAMAGPSLWLSLWPTTPQRQRRRFLESREGRKAGSGERRPDR